LVSQRSVDCICILYINFCSRFKGNAELCRPVASKRGGGKPDRRTRCRKKVRHARRVHYYLLLRRPNSDLPRADVRCGIYLIIIVDVVNNIVRRFCRINSGILSACKTAAAAAGVGIRLRGRRRRCVCWSCALSRSLTRDNNNNND